MMHGRHRQRVAVMASGLLLALAGCSSGAETDAADPTQPGHRSDGTAPDGRSSGAGSEGAAPLPGCAAQPSCDARSTDGRFCRPLCDDACRKTHSHFGFWVNSFEVAHSGGMGRHQGISVLAAEFSYDDRVRLDATPAPGPESRWPDPLLPGLPPDITTAMIDGGAFTAFAMCGAPKMLLDTPLYNHGRTLLRDAAHAANRVELRSAHGDRDAAATPGDASVVGSAAWSARTTSCLGGITDGYCDSVCGNCSYVVPSAALEPLRKGDWSRPESLVFGSGACSGDSSYYGGSGQTSRDSFAGNTYPNSFTHCAFEGCDANDEGPTMNGLWGDDSAVVSGRYGHNSNADAEAAYRAFSACVSPGEFAGDEVCNACGKIEAPNKQDPCVDQTNTAATWWDRTGNLTRDFTPAAGVDEGDKGTTPPRCAWAPFSVSGM
jgi:hypothetical protein